MDEAFPMQQTCCFTGHRPNKLPWGTREADPQCMELKKRIYDVLDALYYSGIRRFLCGMAMGCDTYFAEAVLRLKKAFPEVTLEAVIPCRDQAKSWNSEAQARYYDLLSACDVTTVLQESYTRGCMQRRNQAMISRSSVLVAVFDGTSGGTKDTVTRARKAGLEVISLQP